jgi:hypothetical protein
MLRFAFGLLAALAAGTMLSCGGGGGAPVPTTGSIAGSLTIGGPLSGMAELTAGVYTPGGTTAMQSINLGSDTSAVTGDYTERTVTFQFTELDLGTYEVAVHMGAAGSETFLYRSDPINLTGSSPNVTDLTDSMSFCGPEPWGTISGVIDLADGEWPADKYVYLGFKPGDESRLQYPITEGYEYDGYVEHKTAEGKIIFNMAFLTYGEWTIGFYGYDYMTHQVTTYGERDVAVLLHGGSPNVTGVNFPADFAGDPGSDPVLGTISGTISFNGDLPEVGGFVAVGANTIPPQAGAPISHMEITPEMLDENDQVQYVIENLPENEYGVAIFSYDMATHTADYFGEYPDPVNITEADPDLTGIDFNADVTLL